MVTTVAGDLIIKLAGTPAAVGIARMVVAARLRKWDYSHILDDSLIVVSELVTNAAQQAPYTEIRFQLSRDPQGVIIAVWDQSSEMPKLQPMSELILDVFDQSEESFDDNGGRGLHIVRALSASTGVTCDPFGGKWVWARMIP
ncbi:ATP-binding protein [Actinomadura sp. 3N508]|uniref:ATP-binding protein n=1 Tax=Actinomadura sp. 3N508 TaxID=3375153 RepID=UPI00378EC6EC